MNKQNTQSDWQKMYDFFTMKEMLFPKLVRYAFVFGVLGIYLSTVRFLDVSFFGTILIWIVATIIWRLVCELFLVIFAIHEELVKIREK